MNKDDLRPLVFQALHDDFCFSFDAVQNNVKRLEKSYEDSDVLKLQEIIWELLIQGVLAPGKGATKPNLPYFHVTDYGAKCLQAAEILPYDPNGYIAKLQTLIGQPLDTTAEIYLRESLWTFLGGHYFSSAVMLGVASEKCIELLIDSLVNAISDPNHKSTFEKNAKKPPAIKTRFDALVKELKSIPTLPYELTDSLELQLAGAFTLIRYSRNDAGHPTARPIDRDTARDNLILASRYFKRIYDLISYFATHTI